MTSLKEIMHATANLDAVTKSKCPQEMQTFYDKWAENYDKDVVQGKGYAHLLSVVWWATVLIRLHEINNEV